MKQEDNKEFNAAYDLIHQNSIKIPDKIAFIDDDQTINYSNLSKKVKSFSNQIFKLGLIFKFSSFKKAFVSVPSI